MPNTTRATPHTVRNRASRSANVAEAKAKPWVKRLARSGYLAKGVVYALVGILALQTAFTGGANATGTEGALQSIVSKPFGQTILFLVAIGLFGYVIWRFVQATLDPENNGTDGKGIAQRLGYAAIALAYAGLAVSATAIATGSGSGAGGETGSEDLTARLMAQPFGQWLVGLAGLIVIGAGLLQLYYGAKAKFMGKLKKEQMSSTELTWAKRAGILGLAARGIVFALIGIFLIQAAISYNPEEAGGLGEALSTLARQPYGPWLLALVAVGLIAYGLYSALLACYRRIYF